MGAACEQQVELATETAAYARRRHAEASAGQLAVTVDHADLLVLPRAGWAPAMSRTAWAWARLLAPAATLAILLWRVGTGPFVDGVRTVDGEALAAAVGLAVADHPVLCLALDDRGPWSRHATCRCAPRWRRYYQSLFLNVTLPGGVLGDVHRAVTHGRDEHDVGRGVRAVVWERSAGQVVQAVLTVVVLLALPSPVQASMPLIAIAAVVAVLVVVLVVRARPGRGRSLWARIRSGVVGDIRDGLLARRAWLGIALASAVVVAGHAVTFLIAARTAGTTEPASRMLPLALLAMLAMVLPSIGGWGPREGVTAWVFGAAGLGADQGVATAVVYGVMVFVASLPGAIFLLLAWLHRTPALEQPEPSLAWRVRGVAAGRSARCLSARTRC